MHGHACDCGRPYSGFEPHCPHCDAPKLASRPAPLDERHIDIIARRVVEMLTEVRYSRPLGLTIDGHCVHFHTSMLDDAGRGQCFDCGEQVQR